MATKRARTKITHSHWTNQQLDRLTTLYPNFSNKEIARRLGRTVPGVTAMANSLQLRKTAEYLEKMGRRNVSVRWGS